LTVGFFSPLPPVKSGIADYSALLLPELQKLGDVRVAPPKYDQGLYQIGNNSLHDRIYRLAIENPGVAVIHDAVLNHYFLSTMGQDEYIEEFAFNYGDWARAEARTLWNDRAASANDARYFDRPMLKRIAERSRAVIVHNAEARKRVLQHAPKARVVEIPHFFVAHSFAAGPQPDEAEVLAFRGRAGYLFGVFGYMRESKRLYTVLKAFARLRRARPDVELLVAGEFHSSDLRSALAPHLASAGVRTCGYMSESQFLLASSAVDCCVNLRYPSAGETSGIGVRLMGMGKAVICSEGGENAALPDHTYLPVPGGIREETHLFEYMCLLAGNPQIGRQMGNRAAEFISRYHSMEAVTEQYWKILCGTCS
jgi:glycosyltransferase involved in cell wall biosynthesis